MDDEATRDAAQEFLALLEVVRELRQQCPWDREQTLATSSRYLLEEASEARDAIENGRDRELDDELGDLLVQVLFAANIAEEQRSLDITAMLRRAREKLVRRHPHVYAGVEGESSAAGVQNGGNPHKVAGGDAAGPGGGRAPECPPPPTPPPSGAMTRKRR